jgi:hypothetical protein
MTLATTTRQEATAAVGSARETNARETTLRPPHATCWHGAFAIMLLNHRPCRYSLSL